MREAVEMGKAERMTSVGVRVVGLWWESFVVALRFEFG